MSLETMSPTSAFHSSHLLQGLGGGSGVGQKPPSQSGGDSIQALLQDIDKILKQLLGGANSGDDSATAPVDQGSGPGAGSGAGGDSQNGLDPQLAEMLQFIAQMWQAMQQQKQSGDNGDSDSPGIGGGGGGGGACGGGAGGGIPSDGGGASAPAGVPASSGPPAGATPDAGSSPPATDTPPATGSAPATGSSPVTGGGGGNAEWGNLSTEPQTQANSPEESAKVAGQYKDNLKKDFGLTDAQASGIVGNLWHESAGMNSGISQGGAIGQFGAHQDDNAHGIGIQQWGGARADGLLNYAATHKDANGKPLDPTSQAANYGFMKQELQGDYKGAIDAVKQTSSVADSTKAFCDADEKPTDPQMQSRLALAQQAMASA